jgi:hypothetical protein
MPDETTKDSLELSEQDICTALSGGITLDEFIAWESSFRDSINVRRVYVDICDDLIAGILLSQIVYWFLPTEDGNSKLSVEREGRYWLAKSRDDWWKECRITPKQFDRVSAILEDNKFIETRVFKFNGLAVKHIGLNMQIVFLRVKALLPKGQKQLNSPKGNPALPQKVRPYKEAEITTKSTTEITQETHSLNDFYLSQEETSTTPKKRTRGLEKTCDPRCKAVTAKIFEAYKCFNKVSPGWGAIEGNLLKLFLASHLDWTEEKIFDCIRNRFKSEINPAEEPRKWISSIGNYASGPLDQYGKPKSNGNGFHNGQQSRTNGSGATGHLLDHLPSIEQIAERRKADDERLRLRREARQ